MKVSLRKHNAVKRVLKNDIQIETSRCLYITLFNCRAEKVKQIISLISKCKGVYDNDRGK